MNSIVCIDRDEWDKEVYQTKCVCGHELYLHAFVVVPDMSMSKEYIKLRTSQCTFCEYDKENEKFLCKEFRKAEE